MDETAAATQTPRGHTPRRRAPGTGALVGRFRLIRRLGQGGMGVVFAAHDKVLGRTVALKVVADDHARGSKGLAREAAALARLSHPNVVQVYEVGELGDQLFVAMELVRGQSLEQWLRTPQSAAAVLEAFIQAAQGLSAAHGAGLVHRDFKPSNVMVGSDGRVRVVDFGIAQGLDRARQGSRPPLPSQSIVGPAGTPRYMAPEQFTDATVDARADQFSFCVALYEALYGQPPFPGDTPIERVFAASTGEFRPLPNVAGRARAVAGILIRGLSPKPEDRHPDMDALISALRSATQRRRTLWWGLGALALGALALAVPTAEPENDDPCLVADDGGPWRAADRDLVRAGVGARFDEVASAMDRYSAQWTEAATTACATDQPAVATMACLGDDLALSSAVVEAMGQGSRDAADLVYDGAIELSPPSRCLDEILASGHVALVRDPEALDAVIAAAAAGLRAHDHVLHGRAQAGWREAADAIDAADRSGYAPARVDALLARAGTEEALGREQAAADSAAVAADLATASGDRRSWMLAALRSAGLALQRDDLARADQWLERIDREGETLTADPSIAVLLRTLSAWDLRLPAAQRVSAAREALEIAIRQRGPGSLGAAMGRYHLALALLDAGRPGAVEPTLAPCPPGLPGRLAAAIEMTRAEAARAVGDSAAAIAHARAAVDRARGPGMDIPAVHIASLTMLADALESGGKLDEALEVRIDLHDLALRFYGPDASVTAVAGAYLGVLLQAEDDATGALPHLRRVPILREDRGLFDDTDLRCRLARAEAAAGRTVLGLQLADQIMVEPGIAPEALRHCLVARAHALSQLHAQPAELAPAVATARASLAVDQSPIERRLDVLAMDLLLAVST